MFSQSPNMKIVVKLLLIGGLTVALWIPALMILVLVEERADRQQEVRAEIEKTWGGSQTVQGPLLAVPLKVTVQKLERGQISESVMTHAFFLPTTLEVSGTIEPEIRRRSIFEAVVYTAELRLSGVFSVEDLVAGGAEGLVWERAELLIGLGDLRGLAEMPLVTWNGTQLGMQAAARERFIHPALSVPVAVDPAQAAGALRFEAPLSIRGSEAVRVVPVGRTTRVELESPWADPSFDGAFLPTDRRVSDGGFRATWKVLDLNREFPQRWLGALGADHHMSSTFRNAAFGVRLLPGIDAYARVSRALKYSGIFTLLTLMAFFVVEHGGRQQVHALQYAVIGFGLCLFYLVLLSMGEIVAFDLAFVIAAATIIGAVTWYARGILRQGRGPIAVAGVLAMVYVALFVMLRLEDLALLMGTVLLLVVLWVLMQLTRRLNQPLESRSVT